MKSAVEMLEASGEVVVIDQPDGVPGVTQVIVNGAKRKISSGDREIPGRRHPRRAQAPGNHAAGPEAYPRGAG
jgi:hypothetical protein